MEFNVMYEGRVIKHFTSNIRPQVGENLYLPIVGYFKIKKICYRIFEGNNDDDVLNIGLYCEKIGDTIE